MKLFVSTTSPFARLVMVACLRQQIDAELIFVMPWENPQELLAVNPFSQVPALLTDNQLLITESSVILAHLMPQIFADEKSAALISLSLGIINQTVRAFATERFQPSIATPHPFIECSTSLLSNLLPNAPQLDAQSDALSQIFFGIALGYLKLRLAEVFDKAVSEANKSALEQFYQRDFMQKTQSTALEKLPTSIFQL